MEAASISENEEKCVAQIGSHRILKGAAVYGANGSGKTNLLKALVFFSRMISDSVSDKKEIYREFEIFRLDLTSHSEPAVFEARCLLDDVIYRYGFSVRENVVEKEWLYRKRATGREAKLFTRDGDSFELGKFKEGSGLQSKTRPDSLFISVCAAFNGSISKDVKQGFRMVPLIGPLEQHLWYITAWLCTDKKICNVPIREKLENLLRDSDLGDIRLLVERSQAGKRPDFGDLRGHEDSEFDDERYDVRIARKIFDEHGKLVSEVFFDLFKNESEGTKKLFALGGQILMALRVGAVVIVDEFDSKLHPLLSKNLVKLFNSVENKEGAQLVMSTHDTNLLENADYRRDQIWFTERRSDGSSDLYSLVEYKTEEDKKIRKDASFERDYIQGRYGGIPYLGNFSFWMKE